jgi:hypothetical protein
LYFAINRVILHLIQPKGVAKMNVDKKEMHDIKAWATIRETSIEIAEAIFEFFIGGF